MKRVLKKSKLVNKLFELFISISELIFKILSGGIEYLSDIKLLRRLFFNLLPRNKDILLSTKYGHYILNTNSRLIAKKTYRNKIPYSALSVVKVLEILEAENVNIEYFIDIGANIGTTSISASFLNKILNFVCIEGGDESFELLDKNIKLNNLEERFSLYKKFIGDSEATRLFVEFKEDQGCSKIFENNSELNEYVKKFGFHISSKKEVKTEKLESVLNNIINKKLFLWIDIEGLDLEVISSSITKHTFPVHFEFNPTFYQLINNENQEYFKKVGDYLFNCGYKYFFVEEKNYKKEKISSNFLWEIAKYIGKNKSSTNILVI